MNNQHAKLYGRRWRKLRTLYLARHPLCRMCKADGRISSATEVDHIQKHNGNPELFYAWDNFQGLCADHHRGTKARQERSGKVVGCDINGNPVERRDHWR